MKLKLDKQRKISETKRWFFKRLIQLRTKRTTLKSQTKKKIFYIVKCMQVEAEEGPKSCEI